MLNSIWFAVENFSFDNFYSNSSCGSDDKIPRLNSNIIALYVAEEQIRESQHKRTICKACPGPLLWAPKKVALFVNHEYSYFSIRAHTKRSYEKSRQLLLAMMNWLSKCTLLTAVIRESLLCPGKLEKQKHRPISRLISQDNIIEPNKQPP